MSEIKANSGIVTQINLFTVKPENQQALIDLLIESACSVCHLPGWKSASIHRGLDGKTVVNYAQSADMESQERIVTSLRENGFLTAINNLERPIQVSTKPSSHWKRKPPNTTGRLSNMRNTRPSKTWTGIGIA
jgi:hypothetical protein